MVTGSLTCPVACERHLSVDDNIYLGRAIVHGLADLCESRLQPSLSRWEACRNYGVEQHGGK